MALPCMMTEAGKQRLQQEAGGRKLQNRKRLWVRLRLGRKAKDKTEGMVERRANRRQTQRHKGDREKEKGQGRLSQMVGRMAG